MAGLVAQEPPGPGLGTIIVWNSDQLGGLSVLEITFYKLTNFSQIIKKQKHCCGS